MKGWRRIFTCAETPELTAAAEACRFGSGRWQALLFLGLLAFSTRWLGAGQVFSDFETPLPLYPGETLVIGFMGGWERWNDENRSVRQLALRLRDQPGVVAETVENHRRDLANQLIEKAIDWNRNGRLDVEERAGARIILFGQSWGGPAVVRTARDLKQKGLPVLLTVQVDSVGRGDEVIPANVAAAANFFQRERFTMRGRKSIRAADPSCTLILGNFQFRYPRIPIFPSESTPRTIFGGAHSQMERDPRAWAEVEQLILEPIQNR